MSELRLSGALPQTDNLTAAINRLAAAVENLPERLGVPPESRYTQPSENAELVVEKKMAQTLDIPARTLGNYRRQGKFPGCWIRNGRRILWYATETQEVWKRGIA